MKLKKKATLYLEGIMRKEERDKFLNDIKNRRDIHDFMNEYRWLESRLSDYVKNKKNPDSNSKNELSLKLIVRSDIDKYLKNYSPEGPEKEKEFLSKLEKASQPRNKKQGIKIGFYLNIAASIALLAVLIGGLTHIINNNKIEDFNTNLFAEYFKPWEDENIQDYQSNILTFDRNSLNMTEWGKNINKDQLNSILRSDRMSEEDILLLSILLIQEDEPSVAESYLSDIIEKSQGRLAESARYYLSLLYIRKGDVAKSIQNLEILCNEKSVYSSESCKLLGTLDKKNLD